MTGAIWKQVLAAEHLMQFVHTQLSLYVNTVVGQLCERYEMTADVANGRWSIRTTVQCAHMDDEFHPGKYCFDMADLLVYDTEGDTLPGFIIGRNYFRHILSLYDMSEYDRNRLIQAWCAVHALLSELQEFFDDVSTCRYLQWEDPMLTLGSFKGESDESRFIPRYTAADAITDEYGNSLIHDRLAQHVYSSTPYSVIGCRALIEMERYMHEHGYHGKIELYILGSVAIPELGIEADRRNNTVQLFNVDMRLGLGYITAKAMIAVRAEFNCSTLLLTF